MLSCGFISSRKMPSCATSHICTIWDSRGVTGGIFPIFNLPEQRSELEGYVDSDRETEGVESVRARVYTVRRWRTRTAASDIYFQ